MMSPKEHANLLGIFFWILAGIQGAFLLLIALYVMFFGFVMFDALRSSPGSAKEAGTVLMIILAIIFFYLLLALAFCVTNVIAGYGLRKDRPWAKFWATAGSVMAILSFICGGIWLMPFGIALGVYGLWFIYGLYGQYYFANLNNPQMLYARHVQNQVYAPPPTVNYQQWR